MLTVADIRNGTAAACTLLPRGISPAPISLAQKPTAGSPAASPDDAAELLDDLLIALLDLSGDEWDAWMDVLAALTDELYGRIERYLEAHLS